MRQFKDMLNEANNIYKTNDMFEVSVRGGNINFDKDTDGSVIVEIDRGSERAIIPLTKEQAKELKKWL